MLCSLKWKYLTTFLWSSCPVATTSYFKSLNARSSKFGLSFLKIFRAYSVPSSATPTLTLALKP